MTEESTEALAIDALEETTQEIIDMILDRYGESDDHSPGRMTTAAFMAVKRMLHAFGSASLTLLFAMELQAQGLSQLGDDECEDCEDDE